MHIHFPAVSCEARCFLCVRWGRSACSGVNRSLRAVPSFHVCPLKWEPLLQFYGSNVSCVRAVLAATASAILSSLVSPSCSSQLPTAETPLAGDRTRGVHHPSEGLLAPACGL